MSGPHQSRTKETARKSTGRPVRPKLIPPRISGPQVPWCKPSDIVTLDDDDDDIEDTSESDHYPSDEDESDSFDREPEKILAKRVVTLTEYRVRWKNTDDIHNSWATEEVLRSPTLIAEYEKNLKREQESKVQAQKRAAPLASDDVKEDSDGVEIKKAKLTPTEEVPAIEASSAFDQSLVAEKVVAATRQGISGELNFLVKWQNKSEATLVSAVVANENFPQVVINFYEERLKINPEQWITV